MNMDDYPNWKYGHNRPVNSGQHQIIGEAMQHEDVESELTAQQETRNPIRQIMGSLYVKKEAINRMDSDYCEKTKDLLDMHITMPICFPDASIVVTSLTGENYYEFPESSIGGGILFGRVKIETQDEESLHICNFDELSEFGTTDRDIASRSKKESTEVCEIGKKVQKESKVRDSVDSEQRKGGGKLDSTEADNIEKKANDNDERKANDYDKMKADDYVEMKVDDYVEKKVDDNVEKKVDDNDGIKAVGIVEMKVDDNVEKKVDDNDGIKAVGIVEMKVDDNVEKKVDDNDGIKADDNDGMKAVGIVELKVDDNVEKKVDDNDGMKAVGIVEMRVDDNVEKKVDDNVEKKVDDHDGIKADDNDGMKAVGIVELKVDDNVEKKVDDHAGNISVGICRDDNNVYIKDDDLNMIQSEKRNKSNEIESMDQSKLYINGEAPLKTVENRCENPKVDEVVSDTLVNPVLDVIDENRNVNQDETKMDRLEEFVCDTWASFLHVRLGTIYNVPEGDISLVCQLFNEVFGNLKEKYDEPCKIKFEGIQPTVDDSLIPLRANHDGTKYETVGAILGEDNRQKFSVVRKHLKKFARDIMLIFNNPFTNMYREVDCPTVRVELHENCKSQNVWGGIRVGVREWGGLAIDKLLDKVKLGFQLNKKTRNEIVTLTQSGGIWSKSLNAVADISEIRLEYPRCRMVDPRWSSDMVLGRRIVDGNSLQFPPLPRSKKAREVLCSSPPQPKVIYRMTSHMIRGRLQPIYYAHIEEFPACLPLIDYWSSLSKFSTSDKTQKQIKEKKNVL